MIFSCGCVKQGMARTAFFIFLLPLLYAAPAVAGEMLSTICRNEVVSVGDRRGEVMAKCGPPLSKTQEVEENEISQTQQKKTAAKKKSENSQAVVIKKKNVRERADTWTYNIDGSYRFFIFKEGKLTRIETGGLAD